MKNRCSWLTSNRLQGAGNENASKESLLFFPDRPVSHQIKWNNLLAFLAEPERRFNDSVGELMVLLKIFPLSANFVFVVHRTVALSFEKWKNCYG